MASDIRELLALAQQAEVRGDVSEAVRLLRQAAAVFRERQMGARALQMLRHARRLEGEDVGDEALEGFVPRAGAGEPEPLGDDALAAVLGDAGDDDWGEGSTGDAFGDRRTLGGADRDFGFGDALLAGGREGAPDGERRTGDRRSRPRRVLTVPERGPARADPALDAWCSFCCRPKAEVGDLIAGPAGAFICASCLAAAARLLGPEPAAPGGRGQEPASAAARLLGPEPGAPGGPGQEPASAAAPLHEPAHGASGGVGREPASARTPRSARASAPGPAGLPHGPRAELPSQRLARERLELRAPRLALILGPEGAGKSELLRSLGAPVPPPFERVPGDRLLVDLTRPLTGDEEARILDWLADHPRRRVVLAARGAVPKPVLVLRGEQGEEPVYDTPSLHEAVARALSPAVLSKVDAVLPLPPPDRAALRHLALSLLAAREVALPEDALEQLVQLAEQSGRGVHELAALLARIPRGTYGAP